MIPLSDAAAVRHLFRHFNETRFLRRNILAAPYFPQSSLNGASLASAKRLRVLILAIVESLKVAQPGDRDGTHAFRQHAIIAKYDIGGQPLGKVAAELGIGKSKFYFERRAALGRIAEALKEGAPCPPSANDPSEDDCDPRLAYAETFTASGQFELSADIMRTIVTSTGDGLERIIAWRHLVEALCEGGRMDDAATACRQMQLAITARSFVDADRVLARAELA
ncbi:MAG: hypothetical protein M3Z14_03025, partial [Candidatus Eremiobacteraeota bacterium]|nr:hypothetical protein [Candidatus Eremiobacteraeota bacterium]